MPRTEDHFLVLERLPDEPGYDPEFEAELLHTPECETITVKSCGCPLDDGLPLHWFGGDCPNPRDFKEYNCNTAHEVYGIGYDSLIDGDNVYSPAKGWKIEPGVYRIRWEMPDWTYSSWEDPPDADFWIVEKVADTRIEWERIQAGC